MGQKIELTASDDFRLGAWRADPEGEVRGGVVVIQEIFGVNAHIRDVCERFAALGYAAIAPALFDRIEPGYEAGYSPEEVERGRAFLADIDWDAFMRDTDAARAALASTGKVGVVGFCLGGVVAFLVATRLDGVSCAVGYYGGRIDAFSQEVPRCPTQLHYDTEDSGIPMSNVETVQANRPDCDIHVHEGAGHGFNCDLRASFHPQAAASAWESTTAWLRQNVG